MKPGSSDGILTVLASVLVTALLFVAQHFTSTTRTTPDSPDESLSEVRDSAPSDSTWSPMADAEKPSTSGRDERRTASRPATEPFDNPFGQKSSKDVVHETGTIAGNTPARLPSTSVQRIEDFSGTANREAARGTRTFGPSSPSGTSSSGSRAATPENLSVARRGYKVVGIVDGDTVDILVKGKPFRLRLNGIDTPERGQPFGNTARDAVSRAIGGREVQCVVRDTDRYGRAIADIYFQGVHVNKWLVQIGLAWHYKANNNDPDLAQAEQQAVAAGRGLWGDPRRVAPWNWRKLSKVERDQYR